ALNADDIRHLVAHWFAEYRVPLFRYLVCLLGDTESAADLLQDTFARALSRLAKQAPPNNPSAWLYRIATNLAYDALRRRNRLRWLPFRNHDLTTTIEDDIATAHSVRTCLARLGAKEAEALILYEYAGLNCIEIAGLVGVEAGAIRMRLYRARTQFRQHYQQEVADELS
ncbi:MAG: RNA polymerase sigma factor, partial [Chloroflexota bacterium]